MADVKIVNDQEVPVVEYDDAAIEAGYKAKRKAQIEQDCSLPFDPEAVLEVRHLRKCFPMEKTLTGKVTKELVAVDDISFKLYPGETLGIVGESGCGKTTAGRAILKLHQPSGGQIIFDGQDIPEEDADHLPGSLFLFASQRYGRWHPVGACGGPQDRAQGSGEKLRPGADGEVRFAGLLL